MPALIKWYEIYRNIYRTTWNLIGRICSEILWIKSPQEKVTPKCVSEQSLPKSGPKGIHSSSSAHLYSFIPIHNSTKRGWQSKEPKSAFPFQKGRTLCQTQLQLQKHFPVFSFLPVTAVLQRCYTVMNDKEGNSPNKVPIPKLFLLKEMLISYSWHMTLFLKNPVIYV